MKKKSSHVYPAQCDEVELVLVVDQVLLKLHITAVGGATLVWDKQIAHVERILGLKQKYYHHNRQKYSFLTFSIIDIFIENDLPTNI